MTTTTNVVDILTGEGGYRELPKPLKVGSQTFDFTHILVAAKKANDLVVVIELTSGSDDAALVRKVMSFTRALDVLRSRRSVTAILTSGQAGANVVKSMSRVCRVLPIGSPTGPGASSIVRDWISVLLPLSQPQPVDAIADWEEDIRSRLGNGVTGPFVERLLEEARFTEDAIKNALAASIKEITDIAFQSVEGQP